MENRNQLVKLAVDVAKGHVQKYSLDEANETLRNAFADLAGFSKDGSGRIDYKTFRRHKIEIFEIIEEVITEVIEEGLRDQFSNFVEYRNLNYGDTNVFRVPANNLFRIALISDDNGNLRRQRLKDGQEFTVQVAPYGAKIGEDFYRFLAGRVDWMELMQTLSKSFQVDLTNRIYDAIMGSYGIYNATYHETFTNPPTEDQLVEKVMHLQARTGENVVVYGTKLALRKLAPNATSDAMIDARNRVGYYGTIAGIELREIPQAHKIGTDEFAIDNNFILLLPESGDRMVKVVNEGQPIIQDQQAGKTADMMQEYMVMNRFGIAVICSKAFGFIKW